MALALAALRRLGEDIETSLYQLAFGTVRRSLRKQTKKELLRHVRLGTLDSRLLEITAYLEVFKAISATACYTTLCFFAIAEFPCIFAIMDMLSQVTKMIM
jgi:hypothetical protein